MIYRNFKCSVLGCDLLSHIKKKCLRKKYSSQLLSTNLLTSSDEQKKESVAELSRPRGRGSCARDWPDKPYSETRVC